MLIDTIALVLTIIGAINWLLVGVFQFDIVAWLFGGQARFSAASYTPSSARPASGASRCCSRTIEVLDPGGKRPYNRR